VVVFVVEELLVLEFGELVLVVWVVAVHNPAVGVAVPGVADAAARRIVVVAADHKAAEVEVVDHKVVVVVDHMAAVVEVADHMVVVVVDHMAAEVEAVVVHRVLADNPGQVEDHNRVGAYLLEELHKEEYLHTVHRQVEDKHLLLVDKHHRQVGKLHRLVDMLNLQLDEGSHLLRVGKPYHYQEDNQPLQQVDSHNQGMPLLYKYI